MFLSMEMGFGVKRAHFFFLPAHLGARWSSPVGWPGCWVTVVTVLPALKQNQPVFTQGVSVLESEPRFDDSLNYTTENTRRRITVFYVLLILISSLCSCWLHSGVLQVSDVLSKLFFYISFLFSLRFLLPNEQRNGLVWIHRGLNWD